MSTRGPWDFKPERALRAASNAGAIGPVLHDAQSTWLTYETFYGLREQPFSLSSNPTFFYHSRSHASTFADLLAGIRRRERLSVLTGDIGTGKTTLCRTVLQNLDRKTFSSFVPDPFASREDLLKVLLMDFGVMSVDDLTSGRLKGASRTELSYLLYDFLRTLAPLQAFAVVVIDEAQNLSLSLLEEIRILSDSDGREKQLQVVLVGQLELRQKLKLPEMRQVDQRVSVRCNLEPLTSDGVAGYVAHRLRVAGGTPDRVSFSPEALDLVYQMSGGVPRVINRICDRALHQGYLRRAAIVDREILQTAIPDLGESASDPVPNSGSVVPLPAPAAAFEQDDAPAFSERVDEWLTTVDVAAKAAEEPARVAKPAAEVAERAESMSPLRAAEESGDGRLRFRRRVQPRTHIEQLMRKWTRRLSVVALAMMALAGVAIGLSYVETLVAELTAAAPLPVLPAGPPLATASGFNMPAPPETVPPAVPTLGSYIIEVALFETPQRAQRLAEELAGAGYRAYRATLDLGDRGIRQQVLIGPYATRVEAESDLERLHKNPSYQDARAVERSPSPTAP